jgi:hypothetical protein
MHHGGRYITGYVHSVPCIRSAQRARGSSVGRGKATTAPLSRGLGPTVLQFLKKKKKYKDLRKVAPVPPDGTPVARPLCVRRKTRPTDPPHGPRLLVGAMIGQWEGNGQRPTRTHLVCSERWVQFRVGASRPNRRNRMNIWLDVPGGTVHIRPYGTSCPHTGTID